MASGMVLLASDDAAAGQVWANFLFRDDLQGVVVPSAGEALQRWQQGGLELAVIDLPCQREALDLCRALRACAANPILVLCSQGDEAQAVAACAAGADECIPKPASPALFQAKIHAWLRHGWSVRAESLQPLEAGSLRLDPARGEVSAGGDAAVPLTVLELRLLYLLMSHPGQVLAHDFLVPRVWGRRAGATGGACGNSSASCGANWRAARAARAPSVRCAGGVTPSVSDRHLAVATPLACRCPEAVPAGPWSQGGRRLAPL